MASHMSSQDRQDSAPAHQPYSKRQRLSVACTQCRIRKVRCDAQQPQCRNCKLRNEVCVVTDIRSPSDNPRKGRPKKAAESLLSPPKRVQSISTNSDGQRDSRVPQTNNLRTSDGRDRDAQESPRIGEINNQPRDPSNYARENVDSHLEEESDSSIRDMILNTDGSQHRRKMVGGATLQFLTRYLDRYLEHKGLEPLSPRFTLGMEYCEEVPLSLGDGFELLPIAPSPERDQYISVFFCRIHPTFPLLNSRDFLFSIERLSKVRDTRRLQQTDIPLLVSIYCVLSLGMDEHTGRPTEAGWRYLITAYSFHAHLTSLPYMSTVQALMLLSVALRGRNKEGAGWHLTGLAIRIAQSIGLHRSLHKSQILNTGSRGYKSDEQQEARIWWTCYCTEKMLALECGRPSSIQDADCNQVIPNPVSNHDLFPYWIGLAQIQSRISELLYHPSFTSRTPRELLRNIEELDRRLCEWVKSVEPEELRPGSDLICSDAQLSGATLISIQYHQTMITIHQSALIANVGRFQALVQTLCEESPWKARLAHSESIAVKSARKIATLQLELVDKKVKSRLLTVTYPMLAMMILGFNILKHPGGQINKADLEILTALSHYAAGEYESMGQNRGFISVCSTLVEQIQGHIISDVSQQPSVLPQSKPTERSVNSGGSVTTQAENGGSSSYSEDQFQPLSRSSNGRQAAIMGEYSDITGIFDEVSMEDPWNLWLFSNDNDNIGGNTFAIMDNESNLRNHESNHLVMESNLQNFFPRNDGT